MLAFHVGIAKSQLGYLGTRWHCQRDTGLPRVRAYVRPTPVNQYDYHDDDILAFSTTNEMGSPQPGSNLSKFW